MTSGLVSIFDSLFLLKCLRGGDNGGSNYNLAPYKSGLRAESECFKPGLFDPVYDNKHLNIGAHFPKLLYLLVFLKIGKKYVTRWCQKYFHKFFFFVLFIRTTLSLYSFFVANAIYGFLYSYWINWYHFYAAFANTVNKKITYMKRKNMWKENNAYIKHVFLFYCKECLQIHFSVGILHFLHKDEHYPLNPYPFSFTLGDIRKGCHD